MLFKGLELVKRLLAESDREGDNSIVIADRSVIQKYTDDPSFPFLVSFPRTGSHWLRMIIEQYFERPLLTLSFFNHDRKDYLLVHTHDMELDIVRENVIYLYRDPVDTIFSQLMYYKEDLYSVERIRHWSDIYGRHLSKWLHEEGFTRKKTVLSYERLRKDAEAEFRKVADHFGAVMDGERLKRALEGSSKEKLREKTTHDLQVVNLKKDYDVKRVDFRTAHTDKVWEFLLFGREYLQQDFDARV